MNKQIQLDKDLIIINVESWDEDNGTFSPMQTYYVYKDKLPALRKVLTSISKEEINYE